MKTIIDFYFLNKINDLDLVIITNQGIQFFRIDKNDLSAKEIKNKSI